MWLMMIAVVALILALVVALAASGRADERYIASLYDGEDW